MKQENSLDGKIKDEPEDFHVDLFENIDTILEENLGTVEESNVFAGMINISKHRVDSSESGDEFEEYRKRKKLKNSRKRLMELE